MKRTKVRFCCYMFSSVARMCEAQLLAAFPDSANARWLDMTISKTKKPLPEQLASGGVAIRYGEETRCGSKPQRDDAENIVD